MIGAKKKIAMKTFRVVAQYNIINPQTSKVSKGYRTFAHFNSYTEAENFAMSQSNSDLKLQII